MLRHYVVRWATAGKRLTDDGLQYARNIMRPFLDKAHACCAQMIGYHYVPDTMAFSFSERRVLVPHTFGRWAVRRVMMVIYIFII